MLAKPMKLRSKRNLIRFTELVAIGLALWVVVPRQPQAVDVTLEGASESSSTHTPEDRLLSVGPLPLARTSAGSEMEALDRGSDAEESVAFSLTIRQAHDQSPLPDTEVRFLSGDTSSPHLATLRSNRDGLVSIPFQWAQEHPLLTAIIVDDGVISRPMALELQELNEEERRTLTLDADILVGTLIEVTDGGGNPPIHDSRVWTRKGNGWKVYGVEQLMSVRDYLGCDPRCLGVDELQRSQESSRQILIWRVATNPQEVAYGVARVDLSLPGYQEVVHDVPLLAFESGRVARAVVEQKSDVLWANVTVECVGALLEDDNPHSAKSQPAVVFMESMRDQEVFKFALEDLSRSTELIGIPAGPYRVSVSGGTSGMLDQSRLPEVFDVTPMGGLIRLDLNSFGSLKLTGCDSLAVGPSGMRYLRISRDGVILRQDWFKGDSVVIEPMPVGEIRVVMSATSWAPQDQCKAFMVGVEPATLAMLEVP